MDKMEECPPVRSNPPAFEDFLNRPDLSDWLNRIETFGLCVRLYSNQVQGFIMVTTDALAEEGVGENSMMVYVPAEVRLLARARKEPVTLLEFHRAKLEFPDFKLLEV